MKYEHTIAWAKSMAPHSVNFEEQTREQRMRWVAHYLAGLRHFEALEEHLAQEAAREV